MIADLVALCVLLIAFRWIGPLPRSQWKVANLDGRQWFILFLLALASLLGWLATLVNNDFKSFTTPPPAEIHVR